MQRLEKFAAHFDNISRYEEYNDESNRLMKILKKQLTSDQLERKEWLSSQRKTNKAELKKIMSMFNKLLSLRANDQYPEAKLKRRHHAYKTYTHSVQDENHYTNNKIRYPNIPEDISENIVKFIIQNREHDFSARWAKGLVKVSGDLISGMYGPATPIEVKGFGSKGPSQFGPKKVFGVLYFLDMRNWLDDNIICWRVQLSSKDDAFKSIRVNKNQTIKDQCGETRRPRICWDKLHPQIQEHCVKVYEGTFEGIFVSS